MSLKAKLMILGTALLSIIGLCFFYLSRHNSAILAPQGQIAFKQRHLIVLSTLLMLIVVVPVYIMTFTIAWKYRENNSKAKYRPDWDHDVRLEFLWWAVPFIIISILAVVTYKSSHELDPFKAISSSQTPLDIDVIALDWKWLFIYPQEGIASVNYVRIPQNRPIIFNITSDAPMNSFWIPQLAGQIYAMPGMSTQLHIVANSIGSFRGSSANISGPGFAGMDFITEATSSQSYDNWVSVIRQNSNLLDSSSYTQLSKPSQNNPVIVYGSVVGDIYDKALNKYLVPPNFQIEPALSQGAE